MEILPDMTETMRLSQTTAREGVWVKKKEKERDGGS